MYIHIQIQRKSNKWDLKRCIINCLWHWTTGWATGRLMFAGYAELKSIKVEWLFEVIILGCMLHTDNVFGM